MGSACLPEAFYELIQPFLPPEEEVGPLGGRPRIKHRVAESSDGP